jgi:thiazole synthase
VMPLGSPIGSNKGLRCRDLIEMIIENSKLPVVVDAGIGRPSHAAEAMEMGADAVLVNTAIATAEDPVTAARAFSLAVQAGRLSYTARIREEQAYASASSPLTGFLR